MTPQADTCRKPNMSVEDRLHALESRIKQLEDENETLKATRTKTTSFQSRHKQVDGNKKTPKPTPTMTTRGQSRRKQLDVENEIRKAQTKSTRRQPSRKQSKGSGSNDSARAQKGVHSRRSATSRSTSTSRGGAHASSRKVQGRKASGGTRPRSRQDKNEVSGETKLLRRRNPGHSPDADSSAGEGTQKTQVKSDLHRYQLDGREPSSRNVRRSSRIGTRAQHGKRPIASQDKANDYRPALEDIIVASDGNNDDNNNNNDGAKVDDGFAREHQNQRKRKRTVTTDPKASRAKRQKTGKRGGAKYSEVERPASKAVTKTIPLSTTDDLADYTTEAIMSERDERMPLVANRMIPRVLTLDGLLESVHDDYINGDVLLFILLHSGTSVDTNVWPTIRQAQKDLENNNIPTVEVLRQRKREAIKVRADAGELSIGATAAEFLSLRRANSIKGAAVVATGSEAAAPSPYVAGKNATIEAVVPALPPDYTDGWRENITVATQGGTDESSVESSDDESGESSDGTSGQSNDGLDNELYDEQDGYEAEASEGAAMDEAILDADDGLQWPADSPISRESSVDTAELSPHAAEWRAHFRAMQHHFDDALPVTPPSLQPLVDHSASERLFNAPIPTDGLPASSLGLDDRLSPVSPLNRFVDPSQLHESPDVGPAGEE